MWTSCATVVLSPAPTRREVVWAVPFPGPRGRPAAPVLLPWVMADRWAPYWHRVPGLRSGPLWPAVKVSRADRRGDSERHRWPAGSLGPGLGVLPDAERLRGYLRRSTRARLGPIRPRVALPISGRVGMPGDRPPTASRRPGADSSRTVTADPAAYGADSEIRVEDSASLLRPVRGRQCYTANRRADLPSWARRLRWPTEFGHVTFAATTRCLAT